MKEQFEIRVLYGKSKHESYVFETYDDINKAEGVLLGLIRIGYRCYINYK